MTENFIERLLQYMKIKGINDNQITIAAGLSVGLIGKAKAGGKGMSSINIEKILFAYPDINPDWLLTGRGEMLNTQRTPSNKCIDVVSEDEANSSRKNQKKIPLVRENAIAGFGNAQFAIKEQDVKDYYIVPKFKYCHIDFMIEIHGTSMMPRFNSGDIVACTIIRESHFIQWNHIYIIATTEQGILCKRLCKSADPEAITAISDNPEFPPFDIPKEEITGIALIIGSIQLE